MVKRKANIGRYTRKNKRRVSQQVGLDDDNNNIDLDDNENRNVDLDLDQDVGLSTRQDPDPDLDPAPRRVLVDLDPNVNQQDVRLEVRHKLSAMDKSCDFCQARLFKEEAKGLCCANGQVVLPPLQPTPPQLRDLFITNSQIAKEFRANIRSYNNSLAFASLGANEDILPPGVYTFRINGETHHRIGHLIPDDGAKPRFAQIYIHDPLNEMQNRVHWNNHLNVNVLQLLQNIIHDVNPFFQYYKNAASVIANDESSAAQVQMILRADSAKDGRRYNLPTAAEIAVIIPDEGSNIGYRDIVLHRKSSDVPNLPPVVNIHETHQHYDPLHYVLFFPHGEEGWKIGISFNGNRKGQVSPMNYYAYRLMHRTDFDIVLYGGRLLQQYIVDQFSKMESQRLRFIRKNQIKLRAELYKGLADAVAHGDSDGTTVGQKVILPASYTSSPRNMLQLYHDAMAIVRKYGKPDLFITFTCNPTWPEIKQNLFPNQNASDRPDLIARVFRLKLSAFMDDLIKKKLFGNVVAHVRVIEFQKRGLPHAHILIILQEENKPKSPEDVDAIVSAKLPLEPELRELVKTHMMHGPCGTTFPNCPCMTNGKCSKNFPKEFNSATSIDHGSYPKYERPDNGNFILKNGIPLDNRWVVPYNPFLLKRYQAHINVEVCSSVTAVKYLYKYVYKGHDRIIVEFTNSESNDEVSKFVDARYVSASEAAWRIFHFELHDRYPSIQRLALHLPNEQIITYTEGNAQTALDNRSESTLMAWFKINAEDVEARQLFYHEFPERYTYVNGRGWRQRRRNVKSIGRIYQANPIQGERFYLRLLLHHVRGATSFDDLKRQPGGSISNTFREAAYGLGLLEHDEEWLECLDEAAQTSMPFQMRQLFALILLYGEPSNPMHLWTHFEQKLCEDFLHNGIGVEVSSNRALSDIQNHLNAMNKSLQDYGLPTVQINDGTLTETIDICNPLEQERLAAHNKAMFNEDQMHAFNTVMLEVNGECSHNSLFFLDGPGGSGKTFFYNTLIAAITGQSKKVIAVASSGIAAELLQGGRTAHSALKIPIPIHENSICSISRNSSIANLIRTCSLLVWDEAPMTHRHVFECVDRTFRDLLNIDSPFGGIVVLLGGDFRQILPVVRHGSEGDIVNASLKKSYLWSQVKKLHLTINMRAQGNDGYHEWLISVGNGDVENIQGQGNNICLPPRILETDSQPSTLIQTVYSNVETEHGNDAYLRDRAILTTKNEFVDRINDHIISKVPGEFKTYLSADSIADEEGSNLYPVDFLNTLNLSGLPPHCLRLKENTPVMLLRNLNPKQGLLNGTRLKVKKLGNKMIEAQIISGKKSGTHVFIPRITLIPSDADIPFILRRRQFPIRPCYAMTINKAQGQTIQHIGVYLPYPVFSHGQLYVALSRCHNFDSLRISVPDCQSTANVVYKCILQN